MTLYKITLVNSDFYYVVGDSLNDALLELNKYILSRNMYEYDLKNIEVIATNYFDSGHLVFS